MKSWEGAKIEVGSLPTELCYLCFRDSDHS